MKRIGIAFVLLAVAFLAMPGAASAKKPKTEGLSQEEIKTLKSILPHIKFVASGVGGQPTIQVSGVNVQILSGSGRTQGAVNGAGNLIIGYDERLNGGVQEYLGEQMEASKQTGSHNLVLGNEQSYSTYGATIGGEFNTVSGPGSAVFGFANTASGSRSSVTGGVNNKTLGSGSSVSGGSENKASGETSSVSGGIEGTASGGSSSVSGGELNVASGTRSSVSGGFKNTAGGPFSASSVSGGAENKATGADSAVLGGKENEASGLRASVSGGEKNTASAEASSVSGGYKNTAGFPFSSIFGGKELATAKEFGVALPNVNVNYETLTLLNGWKGPASGSGTPAVGVDLQGIVHFRGGMEQSGAFKSEAFVLPAQFRPAHIVYQAVDMSTSTTGRIIINPSGSVFVEDTAGGNNAKAFTGLDDVTYALG